MNKKLIFRTGTALFLVLSSFFFLTLVSATTIGNSNVTGVVIQYPAAPTGVSFNNNTYGANETDPIYRTDNSTYGKWWINWTNMFGFVHNDVTHIIYPWDGFDKVCIGTPAECAISSHKFNVFGGVNVTGDSYFDGVARLNSITKNLELYNNLTVNGNYVSNGTATFSLQELNYTDGGGTTTSPIQNNGIVYINPSGSQVSNNYSLIFENDTKITRTTLTNNSLKIIGGGGEVQLRTINGTGLANYSYQIPYSKRVFCANLDCKFTKEAKRGDYITISTCSRTNWDRVDTVLDDNNLTVVGNWLGSDCGNFGPATLGNPIFEKSFAWYSTTGALLLNIVSGYIGNVDLRSTGTYQFFANLVVPNGAGYYGEGNLYVGGATSDTSGSTYLQRAGGNYFALANDATVGTRLVWNYPYTLATPIFELRAPFPSGSGYNGQPVYIKGADQLSLWGANKGGSTLYLQGGKNTGYYNSSGWVILQTSEVNTSSSVLQGYFDRISAKTEEAVINDASRNYSFRVEGQTDQNLLYTNPVTEKVGIGTANPTDKLNVVGNLNVTGNVWIGGNVSIKRPYGMFSSTEDQTLTLADTAYPVTFNWTEDAYEIIKEGNSNFSVQQNGDYLIELSAIFQSAVANKKSNIWVQIYNGSQWDDVPRSNTQLTIRTSGSDYVVAVPFIIDVTTSEKFRIMWAGDDNGVFLNYMTNTSYAPETPSIIMTTTKISEITP
jgi:hypothetical protein